jgi:hypothetical protein
LLSLYHRDVALAAALHGCRNDGEDLWKGFLILSSIPGRTLLSFEDMSISICKFFGDDDIIRVAAAASLQQQKKLGRIYLMHSSPSSGEVL